MDPSKWPAAAGYVVNMIMAAVVAFNFLTKTQADYVSVLTVAAVSLVVAFMVHPFYLGAATGAFQTLLVGIAAFGFHHALTDQQVSAAVAIFGFIATVIVQHFGTPQVAYRAGTTVQAMETPSRLAR